MSTVSCLVERRSTSAIVVLIFVVMRISTSAIIQVSFESISQSFNEIPDTKHGLPSPQYLFAV